MLNLRFVFSKKIEQNLTKIDSEKKEILSTTINPQKLLFWRWQKQIEILQNCLATEGFKYTPTEIQDILSKTQILRTPKKRLVQNLKATIDELTWFWPAQNISVSPQHISNLFQKLSGKPYKPNPEKLQFLLEFIQVGEGVHPVIAAAILQTAIPRINAFPKHNIILGHLAAYLFLIKNGYDCHLLVNLIQVLQPHDPETINTLENTGNLDQITLWLELYTTRFATELRKLKQDPSSYQPYSSNHLTDRQKKILNFLNNPDATINNHKVQRLFKISQITASRNLRSLHSLGLITVKGKGRSTYYVKN